MTGQIWGKELVWGESDHSAEYINIQEWSKLISRPFGMTVNTEEKTVRCFLKLKKKETAGIRSELPTAWNLTCSKCTAGIASPTRDIEKNPTRRRLGRIKRAGTWRRSREKAPEYVSFNEWGTYPAWQHPRHHRHRTQSISAMVKQNKVEQHVMCHP